MDATLAGGDASHNTRPVFTALPGVKQTAPSCNTLDDYF